MSIRAFGYVRVSTDEQMKSTLGVRGYINTICRYADAHDLDLGQRIEVLVEGSVLESRERIVIESVSATKVRFLDREGGRRLVSNLEMGDVVLIAEFSRIFRNHREGREVTDKMLEAGVKPVFLDIGGMDFDISSGIGVMVFALHAYFAEEESKKIGERRRNACRSGWAAGTPPIHTPPPGFTWRYHNGKRHLVIDPKQIEILRLIDQWNEEGMGQFKITQKLRELGITGKEMRPHSLSWAADEELKATTIYKFILEAKEMRSILRDTSLRPEDGAAWLAEKNARMQAKQLKRKARLDERRKAAARERLRALVNGKGAA
jgi:DNA invertase Pin-like site-specific DNA recombinase